MGIGGLFWLLKITGLRDKFDIDGNFLESENLNLNTIISLRTIRKLDLNGDGVIGNIIYKKFGSDYHHGSSNHLIEQLKTYELMSGGYVLSKNEHPFKLSLTNIETDHHGGVIGPGLLLERENQRKFLYFSFNNDPVSAYSQRTENGTNINGEQDYSIDYYVVSGSGNSWLVDEFDSTGLFQKQYKYSLKSLLDEELKYNIDLNADNVIGDGVALRVEGRVVIEVYIN